MRFSAVLRVVAPLLVASACASTYDSGYDFQPRVRARPVAEGKAGAGNVSAQVIGVRNDGPDGRAAIEVKVRVERTGETPVRLLGPDVRLVTADDLTLSPHGDEPARPAVPAVGGASSWTAQFPLPGRDAALFDLTTLELRVALDVGGKRETVPVPFDRGARVFLWADPWGWPGPDYKGLPQGWRQ